MCPHALQTVTGMFYAGGEIFLFRNVRFSLYFTKLLPAKKRKRSRWDVTVLILADV